MPPPSRTQLVMVELAAASAVIGVVLEGPWVAVGVSLAAVLLVVAVVPVRRRRADQVVRSRWGMRRRRRQLRGAGIASLVGGDYEVVTVPRGSGGVSAGAIRGGDTWSVPLALPLVGVLNDDPPIPLESLATLLKVEDVPLSNVRVVTVLTSAPAAPPAPDAAPAPPVSTLASRYLVLSLDTAYAARVIAERGGGAAVEQIMRRCVLRAESVLKGAGVAIRRMPAEEVARHSTYALGPAAAGPDGTVPPVAERPDHVALSGAASMTFEVTGEGALERLDRLAAGLRVPFVATTVALQPGPPPHRTPRVRVLVRFSGPPDVVRAAAEQLRQQTRGQGPTLHRVDGEQVPELRATTLLGLPAGRG
jgi:type VII secretion protein EccE